MFAKTPEPPYYAVIFTSSRPGDPPGYADTSARMNELAAAQPGFLGIESARAADGTGITVSYWSDLESIAGWKQQSEHREAQRRGRDEWYAGFFVRIARVERDYRFGERS